MLQFGSLGAVGFRSDIQTGASAAVTARRLATPYSVDCSATRLVVFGNSIESSLGVAPPDLPWPSLTTSLLNSLPDVQGVTLANESVAGSAIVSPGVFGAPPMSSTVQQRLPAYARFGYRNLTVVIHPSIIELQVQTDGLTDEAAAKRALGGVIQAKQRLTDAGVRFVLVLPTAPVTDTMNTTSKTRGVNLNRRVQLLNSAMATAGMTPTAMPTNPLSDSLGMGIPRYFDNLRFPPGYPFPTTSSDGQHPDRDGHQRLALSVASQPDLRTALFSTCRRLVATP